MIHKTKELYGSKLAAADGEIGRVKDFYFDDMTWTIRYLVADTGSWLTGRPVLFSAFALGKLDPDENTLHVNLNKRQLQSSPISGSNNPFTAQAEVGRFRYGDRPPYWESDAKKDFPIPLEIQPSGPHSRTETHISNHYLGDTHLHSTQTITDFRIQSADGVIGYVSGFTVNVSSWTIRELIVATGHWYSGREILISPARIEQINFENSTVMVNLTKEEIQSGLTTSSRVPMPSVRERYFPAEDFPK